MGTGRGVQGKEEEERAVMHYKGRCRSFRIAYISIKAKKMAEIKIMKIIHYLRSDF